MMEKKKYRRKHRHKWIYVGVNGGDMSPPRVEMRSWWCKCGSLKQELWDMDLNGLVKKEVRKPGP